MNTNEMPIVELTGAPRQWGRIHGETLRARIAETHAHWRDNIATEYDADVDRFIDEFLAATRFPVAMERWTPGLIDEIEGIAEGAGQPLHDMLALQFMDERWLFDRARKAAARKADDATGADGKNCTSFGDARPAGGPTLMGQTMDIEAWSEGLQALLHMRDADGTETYLFTIAGFLGLLGLNGHGVGICCNALFELDHCDDGLPVAAVVRGVLRQHDADAAAAFVHRIRHASGQNYVIGGPGAVMSLECSAASVATYTPAEGATRICHTNHPFSNSDTALYRARAGKTADEPLDFAGRQLGGAARRHRTSPGRYRQRRRPGRPEGRARLGGRRRQPDRAPAKAGQAERHRLHGGHGDL